MINKELTAKNLLDARELAVKELKVSKAKQGLLSVNAAYDEHDEFAGWIAFFNGKRLEIKIEV